MSRAATPMPVTSVPVFNGRPCPELCFSSVGTTWGYTRLDRPGSCSKGDHAVVARRSPARHARVTPASCHSDRPPGRPGDLPAPRPRSPPVARPGDHLRRGDPARPRDARGPTVRAVYVHGLCGSAHQLDRPRRPARHRGPPALAVDLPGFGCTRPPAGARLHPGPAHADALLCFLAGRGRPVHLLGNSLGGAIALSVAARRPELVRTLTLVSPAMPDRRPGPAPGVGPAAGPRAAARAPRVGAPAGRARRDDQPRPRRAAWSRVCFGDPPRPRAPARRGGRGDRRPQRASPGRSEAVDRTARAMVRSWWRGESLWAVAARVRVPTLVVWGDRDRLVAPRLAARTTRRGPGGAAAHAPRRGARRPDRGGGGGGRGPSPGCGRPRRGDRAGTTGAADRGRCRPVASVAPPRTSERSRSTDGATAARRAGRRADQGRGGALQPPPDHPRRRAWPGRSG